MKIICISDTHSHDLRDLNIPDGDVLIHAGDATGLGTISELAKFNHQLGCLPHKHKIIIPGNHDWLYERDWGLATAIITNATVLRNSGIVINGVKFWGSPVTPRFCDWAFNFERGADIKRFWDIIPANTNVLITHGPPKYLLDQLPNGQHVGCEDLLNRIQGLLNLKLHVFGHIHHGYGLYKSVSLGTTFINASICTEDYQPLNKPIIFEI